MEKTVDLKDFEQIDNLHISPGKIIQQKNFLYGLDAVLLADYAKKKIKSKSWVCDLCSGNGIVPLLLALQSNAEKIFGLEIQSDCVEMANRSVKLNSFEDRIKIVQGDLKLIRENKNFLQKSFDVLTVNPPYMKKGTGKENPVESINIARHEIMCSLDDVLSCAKFLLKDKASLFMIHRAYRLSDIFAECTKHKFGIKSLKFVHPNSDKNSTMVLIEAKNNSQMDFVIESPLFVYDEKGNYSSQINKIYNR